MTTTQSTESRFAAGDFKVSDLQVGDELVVFNPYGGPKHNGISLRYKITKAHYDSLQRVDHKFVKVAAEEGTSQAGTVYVHFTGRRVNKKTGYAFSSETWHCINRERIVAVYRNGEAI